MNIKTGPTPWATSYMEGAGVGAVTLRSQEHSHFATGADLIGSQALSWVPLIFDPSRDETPINHLKKVLLRFTFSLF